MIFLIGLSPDFLDPDEDTEPPTRKLEDDVDGHADAASTSHQANNPSLGDQSSIISRDDSHSAIVGNDVSGQGTVANFVRMRRSSF